MAERILSEETINTFREYLVLEEKNTATVEKYLRDVRAFHLFACQQAVTKERMMAYKKYLIEKGYANLTIVHSILGAPKPPSYTFFKNEFEGEFVLPSFFVLLLLTPIFPLFYVLFLRLLLIFLCSCAKIILIRNWAYIF